MDPKSKAILSTQLLFSKVLTKWPSFLGPNSVKTWVITVGNKLCFGPAENLHPYCCTHSKIRWCDSIIFCFKMLTFMCKNVVLTLGTLGTLEKLVKNKSYFRHNSGTSVARPLKFCVSYCDIKSYLWSNFHGSISSGSRVIGGSHCPSST